MPENKLTEPAKQPTIITITLPTNAYFLSGIRNFTLGLVKNMTEFSEQWAFRFQSIVDELCNNAIEHGSKPGDNIQITFKCNPQVSMEITVSDHGTGISKMTAEALQKLIDERRDPKFIFTGIRGRGLSKIVAEWTDELHFKNNQNGGIEVSVTKYLNDPKLKQTTDLIETPNHLVLN